MLWWIVLLGVSGAALAQRINGRNITRWRAPSNARSLQEGDADDAVVVAVDPRVWRFDPASVWAKVDVDTWVVRAAQKDAPGVLRWSVLEGEYKHWEGMPSGRGWVVGLTGRLDRARRLAWTDAISGTGARVVEEPGADMRAWVRPASGREEETKAALAALPFVLWLDRAPNVTRLTAASLLAEGVDLPGEEEQEDWEECCANQTVALADTGLDRNHCWFMDALGRPIADALLPATASSIAVPETGHAKLRGYVRVCPTLACAAPTDTQDAWSGHGTHVAGILAAPRVCGGASAAPRSRIVFFDLESAADQLEMPFRMDGMWRTAIHNGAWVFSASWGGWCDGIYDHFASEFDRFAYENPEFVFIVAAGNCGQGAMPWENGIASPGSAKNVISVGATFISPEAYAAGTRGYSAAQVQAHPDRFRAPAWFSSRGPAEDGRTAPLLAGPGVQVRSARAGGPPGHMDTTFMSGTSMATPNIPVTLVRQQLQRILHATPWSATVRATLMVRARAPVPFVVNHVGADVVFASAEEARRRTGFGVYHHAENDIEAVQAVALQTEQLDEYCFTLRGTDVSIALAWTDPPGSPLATRALVNVLQALVFTALPSATPVLVQFDAEDDVNNHRRYDLSVPSTAVHVRVIVRAAALQSAQPYALVVTNATRTACTPCLVPEPCAVPNGRGVRPGCGAHGECVVQSCDAGFFMADETCLPVYAEEEAEPLPPCFVLHGTGVNVSGVCQAQSCDPGFVYLNAECACAAPGVVHTSSCLAYCRADMEAPACLVALHWNHSTGNGTGYWHSEEDWVHAWSTLLLALLAVLLLMALLVGAQLDRIPFASSALHQVSKAPSGASGAGGAGGAGEPLLPGSDEALETRLEAQWTYVVFFLVIFGAALVGLFTHHSLGLVWVLGFVFLALTLAMMVLPYTATLLGVYVVSAVGLTAAALTNNAPTAVVFSAGVLLLFILVLLSKPGGESVGNEPSAVPSGAAAAGAGVVVLGGILVLAQYDMDAHGPTVFVLTIVLVSLAGLALLASGAFMVLNRFGSSAAAAATGQKRRDGGDKGGEVLAVAVVALVLSVVVLSLHAGTLSAGAFVIAILVAVCSGLAVLGVMAVWARANMGARAQTGKKPGIGAQPPSAAVGGPLNPTQLRRRWGGGAFV